MTTPADRDQATRDRLAEALHESPCDPPLASRDVDEILTRLLPVVADLVREGQAEALEAVDAGKDARVERLAEVFINEGFGWMQMEDLRTLATAALSVRLTPAGDPAAAGMRYLERLAATTNNPTLLRAVEDVRTEMRRAVLAQPAAATDEAGQA